MTATNQLVSSTDADGKTTKYQYDAAGRLVKEGAKTYRYGYLDKVLSVTEGKTRHTYSYHVDGQLATATKRVAVKPKKARRRKGEKAPEPATPAPAPETEEFYWDGLALVKRGGTSYVNEPHPGGGAAVFSSKDGVMFNDILGTTLGVEGGQGYTATPLTAFGDDPAQRLNASTPQPLFTGKPHVDGLGHAFLMRNYRAGLGKWLTADPLGYPDCWNQLAYCGNDGLGCIDYLGGFTMIQFLFCDMNNDSHYVNSASNLFISNRSQFSGVDAGGFFYSAVKNAYFSSDINTLTVVINLAIYVSPSLKRSSEFVAGETTRYYPHKNVTGEADGKDSVYEAICAHERGHASCFFSKTIPEFSALLSVGVDNYKNNSALLQAFVNQQFSYATALHVQQSGEYANDAVYAWFAGESTWRAVNVDRTSWSTWVKKGENE